MNVEVCLLSMKELEFPGYVIYFFFVKTLDLLLFPRRSPHCLGYHEYTGYLGLKSKKMMQWVADP